MTGSPSKRLEPMRCATPGCPAMGVLTGSETTDHRMSTRSRTRAPRGSGRDITVQADTLSEARQTVIDMFPGALVTGVRRVKLREALRKL
jgi:hypothetical protein